ncbi:hypothetical protein HOA80_04565 [archaeon]|nr:hypothetical protein [archaeon]
MGLILVIIVGFFLVSLSSKSKAEIRSTQDSALTQTTMKADFETMIYSCVEYAVQDSIPLTGIREQTKNELEELIVSKIITCTTPILSEMQKQNYEIKKGRVEVIATINPETIIINVDYPLDVQKELQKIELKEFEYSFDRASKTNIPSGITQSEIRIISPDGKAELKISENTIITDSNGNPIETIGTKVLDHHFDGLNNGIIIGELVYDNFPDGAQFSKPIEMTIEFDNADIPEGYTKENLRIAYWDEEDGIWYAPPTSIENNMATANITHFSKYAISVNKHMLMQTVIFEQRFKPTSGGPPAGKRGVWAIEGEDGTQLGTTTLHDHFYKTGYGDKTRELLAKIETNTMTQEELDTYPDVVELNDFFSYGEGIDALMNQYGTDFVDYKKEFEKINFISTPNLYFGYFLDPSNAKDNEFIDGEVYDSRNLGGYNYGLDSKGYPYVELEEGAEFGWHNLLSAGGMLRPGEGEEAFDFVVFKGNGDAVFSILGMEVGKKPWALTYVYPMKDTVSDELGFKHYIKNFDGTYSFYCEFADEDNSENENKDGKYKKVELSPTTLQYLQDDGFDTTQSFAAYGRYGVNAIKRYEHPLSRNELHVQCERFLYIFGNGIAYTNFPNDNMYEGSDINIPLEIFGAAILRQPWN